jgi:hypothetical protein
MWNVTIYYNEVQGHSLRSSSDYSSVSFRFSSLDTGAGFDTAKADLPWMVTFLRSAFLNL